MSHPFKNRVTQLIVTLTLNIPFIPALHAAPIDGASIRYGEIPYKIGFSIESIDTMEISEPGRAALRNQIEQTKIRGYVPVPDEKFYSLNKVVEVMARRKPESISLANILGTGKLRNAPSSVADTTLADAKLLAATTGGTYQNGQWSGMSRIYETKDLGIVILDENDYVTVRAGIVWAKEAINESIHGAPAMLYAEQSASGENRIKLTWITPRKRYILRSNAADLANGKAGLLVLARGIKD